MSTFFDELFCNAMLPRSFTSYFVALIPKVNCTFTLGDYRPISLLGCLYKIQVMVLTAKLSTMMDDLISSVQSALVKGGNLVDGILVENEVIGFSKKSHQKCLIFKLDFEKAYDSISLSFLDYMLRRFGFDDRWRAWMCVVFSLETFLSWLMGSQLRR